MADRKSPWAERRGGAWRARWPDRDGNIRSASRDDDGNPFEDKAAAEGYGWEQVRLIGRGQWLDPRKSGITLAEWVGQWWKIARIDELAAKSGRKYKADLEIHILPAFGDWTLAELAEADADLAAWVTKQHADYAKNTAQNRRNVFSTILNAAVEARRMGRNPLKSSSRRGRRGGRVTRPPERAWVTPLQALLIAERAAVWSHNDKTTFILLVALAYTGMRSREAVGLERRHLTGDTLRVQWQLSEHTGGPVREPPKDDSRRTIDMPDFLVDLLQAEMREHDGVCDCGTHQGGPYVFRGGPNVPHLASVTLNDRFRAAACSRYYSRPQKEYAPVPIVGEPFPGIPVHGRQAADAMWVPIVAGAVPHSLRHSHRVWSDDDGIPEVLKHERLGHLVEGIRGVYSHVSPDARQKLLRSLTDRWEQSLRERAALHPRSPLPLLDDLLRPFREQTQEPCSQYAPTDAVTPLRARVRHPA